MAVSTTTWFKNAIQGVPQIGFDIDIYETSTTPKLAVGHKYTRSDGAEFVYSHFGGTISHGGLITSADVSESSRVYTGSSVIAAGSVTAIGGETINPGVKGSHFIQLRIGTVSVDQFAGGYFHAAQGDGGHYQYRIRGNTASAALTSGAVPTTYIELWEPLQQSIATIRSGAMRIVGSRYANLESASAATDGVVAGVSTASHAAAT
ncbi:hypothetical protein LCGC14_1692920, partial [marine sediment metagenome]